MPMERYDYTKNGANADDLLSDVERLDVKQRLTLHKMMEQMMTDVESEELKERMEWWDNSILHVLKEYAEITSSVLDVERDQPNIIQVTLRNHNGIEFTYDCRCLYMVIIMAVMVIVDVEDGAPVLVLTYDTSKFVN